MIFESSVLGLLWLVYFALHSLLASLYFKDWVAKHFRSFTPYYRLSYNIFAGVSLLPMFVVMLVWRGEFIILWDGIWSILMNGIAVLALLLFYHSTRFYDMSEFLGTRQIRCREHGTSDKAPMCVSPYHRFVRHPWYTFGIVLIWTRDMDQMQLISSVAMTLYFIVGSLSEEKKLLIFYGEQYSSYQKRVPGLIPLPWKFLGHNEVP